MGFLPLSRTLDDAFSTRIIARLVVTGARILRSTRENRASGTKCALTCEATPLFLHGFFRFAKAHRCVARGRADSAGDRREPRSIAGSEARRNVELPARRARRALCGARL